MKKLMTLCLLLIAVPCVAEMVSVVHQPAELRDRASVARSSIIRQLPIYAPLEVVGSEDRYFKVKDATGKVGFVHQSLVGDIDSVEIKADVCNVRKGPSTDSEIAFKAQKGMIFKAVKKEGDWIEIIDKNGAPAWIWKYLTWGY